MGLTPRGIWGRSLSWGAECRISQPGAVLSPTAKRTLSRCSAQIHPSVTALETCKSTRGKEERRKHPEGQRSIKREEMWIINLKIVHVSLIWAGCWLTVSWGGSGRYENEASAPYHCLQFLPALFHEALACCKAAVLYPGDSCSHSVPICNLSKLEKHLELLCNGKFLRNESDNWYKSASEHWQKE